MIRHFDIIIVGASLAGLNAAHHAKANHPNAKILLIDKKHKVGQPVNCAEGTFLEALGKCGVGLSAYRHCFVCYHDDGTENRELYHHDIIANRIKYLRMSYPGGKQSNITFKYFHPAILNRDKFEGYLLARISITKDLNKSNDSKRVYVLFDTKLVDMKWNENRRRWKLIMDRGNDEPETEFYTKSVIGADGMNSKVGKLTGLKCKYQPNEYFKCIQFTLDAKRFGWGELSEKESRTMSIIFDPEIIPFGYGWIFPKSSTVVNLGLGVLGGTKINLDDAIKEFRYKYFFLDSNPIRTVRSNVPARLPREYLDIRKRIILTGDAGDFVLSSFGAGIATSLWTGMMAGKYIHKPSRFKFHIENELMPKLIGAHETKNKLCSTDRKESIMFLNRIRWLFKLHRFFPITSEKLGGKNSLLSK